MRSTRPQETSNFGGTNLNHAIYRLFAIVEAGEYADVQVPFTDQMWNGPIEVLPVNDMVAQRKDWGEWGK